jgi:hypothetical protein
MFPARKLPCLLAAAALLVLGLGSAEAQWLFLGRKVVGKVENMVQSPDAAEPAAPRYDVAVVMLDAPASKVYETVVATVAEHPDYSYKQRNDANFDVEVTNGTRSVGVHVVPLDEKLSQLIIASVIIPGETSPVPFTVQNVLRICEKMHVTCSTSSQP